MSDMHPLALISGATGGIGSVIAQRLAYEGYRLVLLGQSQHKMNALLDTLPIDRVTGLCFNLRHDAEWWRVQTVLDAHQRNGRVLTFAVSAHGAAPIVKASTHLMASDMRRVWEIDVLGAFMLARMALIYMREHAHGGSITFLSSVHCKQTFPQRTAYASAKAAIGGMTRALAVEYGRDGIRVNAVCPWQVSGPRTDAFLDAARLEGEDLLEQYQQRSPMRRLITPEDIADAVLFLARNTSMNGCELVMDGGMSASMWHKGFVR